MAAEKNGAQYFSRTVAQTLVGTGTANSYRSVIQFNVFVFSAGRCPGSISTLIVSFQAAWFLRC